MTSLKFPLKKPYTRVRGYWDHVRAGAGPWFGVDYACKVGSKVTTVRSGAVNKVGYGNTGAGNYIIIQHRDSKGKLVNLYSTYFHLSKIYVKAHQKVATGQLIGLSGRSGWVTGPHLHLSMLKKVLWIFRPIDPENKKTFVWKY